APHAGAHGGAAGQARSAPAGDGDRPVRGDRHRGAPARRDAAPAAHARPVPHAVRPAQDLAHARGHHRPARRRLLRHAVPQRQRRRDDAGLAALRRDRAGHAGPGAGARRGSRLRQGRRGRSAGPPAAHLMSRLPADDLQWALQRRLEDVFAKLGEKFGDLTGRVETEIHPEVSFDEVGGLKTAKELLRGFALALTSPESYERWGIAPPKGVLLYGPPGTGKSKLARALATTAGAIFYHVKLLNLTSKF